MKVLLCRVAISVIVGICKSLCITSLVMYHGIPVIFLRHRLASLYGSYIRWFGLAPDLDTISPKGSNNRLEVCVCLLSFIFSVFGPSKSFVPVLSLGIQVFRAFLIGIGMSLSASCGHFFAKSELYLNRFVLLCLDFPFFGPIINVIQMELCLDFCLIQEQRYYQHMVAIVVWSVFGRSNVQILQSIGDRSLPFGTLPLILW